jgi:hypothetical protein
MRRVEKLRNIEFIVRFKQGRFHVGAAREPPEGPVATGPYEIYFS